MSEEIKRLKRDVSRSRAYGQLHGALDGASFHLGAAERTKIKAILAEADGLWNDESAELPKYGLLYEVLVFDTPHMGDIDRAVNSRVAIVRNQHGHNGPVRVVSLSNSGTPIRNGLTTLTIEYTGALT